MPEVIGRPIGIAQLARRLAGGPPSATPLLVVRLPALEQTAWREGLRKARSLERRAAAAFAAAAARVLRAEDIIAHDRGSDIFMAALTAPTRATGAATALAIDARSALARISASLESATRLAVDTGWTTYARDEDLADAIRRGLARGAQERERYAFFSAVGHELRTPLASICGYLETLLDGDIDAATRARFLRIAHKESQRLSRLVDGMFEISLLDLQATAWNRSSASLGDALEAALDACAANAAARAITLERVAPAATMVEMDADRLTLVLINVIDNAIKHGRPGGIVRITGSVADARDAGITIDDDGPGIAESDRERIFRLGARGETAAPGTGIGLALVGLMLERAGGRIDVGTSPLGGARFQLHVRRSPASSVAAR